MSRKTPEISVLLPVRNGAEFIDDAITSICSQTFSDWELLIIDDGSTDRTSEICERRADEDSRIRLHSIGEQGLVPALNAGLELARGTIIARMDADDVSLPDRLEKQRRALIETPEEAVVSCLVDAFPAEQVGEGMGLYVDWLNSFVTHEEIARNFFVESPIAHPTSMLRKKTVSDVGGYSDNGWPEDYDLWMRLFFNGAKFSKVPESLYMWRDREGRLSRTSSAYSLLAFRKLKSHYLEKKLRGADERNVAIWGAGKTGRWWCRELITAGINVLSFIDIDTTKIGNCIGDIPVIGPGDVSRLDEDILILGCVGARGARDEIRRYLLEAGKKEENDFIMLA